MMFDCLEDAAFYFISNPGECLTIWVESCWPDGLFCSECECYIDMFPEDGNGRRVLCPDCGQRIDVYEGSILETSRVKLSHLFTIIWNAVSNCKKRCSGHVLADILACDYHKIRHAIKAVDQVKSQLRKQGVGFRSNKFDTIVRGCSGVDSSV